MRDISLRALCDPLFSSTLFYTMPVPLPPHITPTIPHSIQCSNSQVGARRQGTRPPAHAAWDSVIGPLISMSYNIGSWEPFKAISHINGENIDLSEPVLLRQCTAPIKCEQEEPKKAPSSSEEKSSCLLCEPCGPQTPLETNHRRMLKASKPELSRQRTASVNQKQDGHTVHLQKH